MHLYFTRTINSSTGKTPCCSADQRSSYLESHPVCKRMLWNCALEILCDVGQAETCPNSPLHFHMPVLFTKQLSLRYLCEKSLDLENWLFGILDNMDKPRNYYIWVNVSLWFDDITIIRHGKLCLWTWYLTHIKCQLMIPCYLILHRLELFVVHGEGCHCDCVFEILFILKLEFRSVSCLFAFK